MKLEDEIVRSESREPRIVRRPASLAEVARWTLADAEFDAHLRDFLHEFAVREDDAMLREEPPILHEKFADEGVRDAYLAATAAYLARTIGCGVPRWVMNDDRRARCPWFASPRMDALHMMLLWESLPEFRERNLFVSASALTIC